MNDEKINGKEKALQALKRVWESAKEKGGDKMSMAEINRRIAQIRKERKCPKK